MGIRVHKLIGYGLTDLKCKKLDIIDERINPKGYLGNHEDPDGIWSKKKYKNYIKRFSKKFDDWKNNHDFSTQIEEYPSMECWDAYHLYQQLPNDWSVSYSVIHDAEYGIPEILVIIPPDLKDCSRYGNVIDYFEETQKSPYNRYELLKTGIFPYDHSLMDARNGKIYQDDQEFKGFSLARLFCLNLSVLEQTESDHFEPQEGFSKEDVLQGLFKQMDFIAEKLGFSNRYEAQKFIKPSIPWSVQSLCRFAKLFRDEKTIYQLRPLLYVYWS